MQEGGLVGLVARFLPGLKMNGLEAKGPCPFCDGGKETLRVGESAWRTVCCCEQERFGDNASGFLQSFLNCTAEEAEHKLSNGNLPDSQPIEQAKLIRPPFFGIRQVLDRPDDKVWIHTLAAAVFIARELIPERIHLGLIQGRSWDDLGLPPARFCVLLPTNSDTARQVMDRLALRLADAGHTVRLIDPSDQEPHWTLLDAHAAGKTHDEIMTWAKSRTRPGPKNDAAQQIVPAALTITEHDSAAAASPNAAPEPELPAPRPQFGPQYPAPEAASKLIAEVAIEASRPLPASPRPILAVVEKTGALRKPDQEPDPDQLPAFSEVALADSFVLAHGEDWRYTDEERIWRKWDGLLWREDKDKTITWEATQEVRRVIHANLADSTPAQRMKAAQLRTTNAVIGLALCYREVAVKKDAWNCHPMLLGTPAGLIDLETGKLMEPRKSAMITKSTLIAPAEGAHPYWDRVVQRASGGDAGMLSYLQKLVGYAITGDTRQEAMFYLHGPGNSGKSKFILPIQEILGDYAKSFEIDLFLAGSKENMSEKFAQLADVRLAIGSEPQEGARWHEGRLKLATGRNRISCRDVYARRMEYLPQFKLWVEGNSKPALNSVGEEIRRRFHLIDYKGGTIPEDERILDLPDRLRAEYPQILHWALRGTRDWLEHGLGMPEQVEHDVSDYLSDEDSFGAWMDECLDRSDSHARTKTSAAYQSFKRWMGEASEYIPSKKAFTVRLRNRGFSLVKSGDRYFVGFKLIGAGYEPAPADWMPPDS